MPIEIVSAPISLDAIRRAAEEQFGDFVKAVVDMRQELMEQLGNVGSEVRRMRRAQGRNARAMSGAFERALELLDLTLADWRWRDRLREIARARELLCDAAAGGADYGTTLEDLDRYFLAFAVAARAGR